MGNELTRLNLVCIKGNITNPSSLKDAKIELEKKYQEMEQSINNYILFLRDVGIDSYSLSQRSDTAKKYLYKMKCESTKNLEEKFKN